LSRSSCRSILNNCHWLGEKSAGDNVAVGHGVDCRDVAIAVLIAAVVAVLCCPKGRGLQFERQDKLLVVADNL